MTRIRFAISRKNSPEQVLLASPGKPSPQNLPLSPPQLPPWTPFPKSGVPSSSTSSSHYQITTKRPAGRADSGMLRRLGRRVLLLVDERRTFRRERMSRKRRWTWLRMPSRVSRIGRQKVPLLRMSLFPRRRSWRDSFENWRMIVSIINRKFSCILNHCKASLTRH